MHTYQSDETQIITILILLFSSTVFGSKMAGLGTYKEARENREYFYARAQTHTPAHTHTRTHTHTHTHTYTHTHTHTHGTYNKARERCTY